MFPAFTGILSETTIPTKATYRDFQFVNSGSTTTTFPAMSIGPASASRYVLVVVTGVRDRSTNFTGVTIGGISATLLYQNKSTSTQEVMAFFIALVPTGTTADVVVTDSTPAGTTCSTYSITGLRSTTPISTGFQQTASSNALTVSGISVPAQACVIAAVATGGGGQPFSWTGVNLDYTNQYLSNWATSGASKNYSSSGTINVTAQGSSAEAFPIMQVIVLR